MVPYNLFESIFNFSGVDEHLEFVHGELAKSIHIIDKHSIEIDNLTKLKQAENLKVNSKAQVEAAVDKVADLQDNLKTVQLHIASICYSRGERSNSLSLTGICCCKYLIFTRFTSHTQMALLAFWPFKSIEQMQ